MSNQRKKAEATDFKAGTWLWECPSTPVSGSSGFPILITEFGEPFMAYTSFGGLMDQGRLWRQDSVSSHHAADGTHSWYIPKEGEVCAHLEGLLRSTMGKLHEAVLTQLDLIRTGDSLLAWTQGLRPVAPSTSA